MEAPFILTRFFAHASIASNLVISATSRFLAIIMCTMDSDNWRKSADWNTCREKENDDQSIIKEEMGVSIEKEGKKGFIRGIKVLILYKTSATGAVMKLTYYVGLSVALPYI